MSQSLLLTQHFLDKQGIKKGLQKDCLPIIIGQRIFKAKQNICTSYLCTSAYLLASVCATDGDGTRSYSALLLTAFDISNQVKRMVLL